MVHIIMIYYWAKVYSRGLRKKEDYDGLKKVISINFLNEP